MYIYIHIHTYIYIYIYTYMRIYECIFIGASLPYPLTLQHIQIYIYVYVHIFIHIQGSTRAFMVDVVLTSLGAIKGASYYMSYSTFMYIYRVYLYICLHVNIYGYSVEHVEGIYIHTYVGTNMYAQTWEHKGLYGRCSFNLA